VDALQELLERLERGELGDPLPVLAYVAGQAVELDGGVLNEARRRALVRLATTGDPQREIGVDEPAVKELAVELYADERRDELARGVDAVVLRVRELPRVREAAIFLAADVDLAWRLFALGLLAEELGE
jgi:hypothetical protein